MLLALYVVFTTSSLSSYSPDTGHPEQALSLFGVVTPMVGASGFHRVKPKAADTVTNTASKPKPISRRPSLFYVDISRRERHPLSTVAECVASVNSAKSPPWGMLLKCSRLFSSSRIVESDSEASQMVAKDSWLRGWGYRV